MPEPLGGLRDVRGGDGLIDGVEEGGVATYLDQGEDADVALFIQPPAQYNKVKCRSRLLPGFT